MNAGSVYMISCFSGSYVKIGHSANPDNRHRDLQTGCPFPLEVLATVPGGSDLEGVLHLWFGDLRLNGEWFRFPLRNATDQLRTAVWDISRMDGCPFDWQELYVDVKRYYEPLRPSWRERVAASVRREPEDAARARLLHASGALKSIRDVHRSNRHRGIDFI